MDKLKFWAFAIGFLSLLWWMSPDDESAEALIDQQATAQGVKLASPDEQPKPMAFPVKEVKLQTKRGKLPLKLGIAYKPEQQQSGMMHYRVWPNVMHGLLFLFREEDYYSMWMRNTYLPLDMLFLNRYGEVTEIARNTTPLSDEAIRSQKKTLAVLEIPAGKADEWKIEPGDQLLLNNYFQQRQSQ